MMRRIFSLLVLTMFVLATFAPAVVMAVEPDEMLKDPKQEARARDISEHLRCLVCQNQSIDDSNAPLAKDLRILVRERLSKGDSNEQAINYIVDRYGEFVLLQPRFNGHTLILWLGPPLLLLLAAGYFLMNWRRRSSAASSTPVKALSPEEQAQLEKILKED